MGYFASQRPNRFGYLLHWRRTVPKLVPRVQLMVEIGDDLLYTSSVFDHMKASNLPMQVSWVGIFTAIFDTIAYRCLRAEIEVKFGKTSNRILDDSKREVHQFAQMRNRNWCFLARQGLYDYHKGESPKLINCVHRFAGYHSKFIPDAGHWHETLDGVNFHGKEESESNHGVHMGNDPEIGESSFPFVSANSPCLQVSREEICALAIILGMNLRSGKTCSPDSLSGVGGFGLSLSAAASPELHWRLRIVQTSRRPRHEPSAGSGYSILFAKFLACGSIPFARANSEEGLDWIKSVYIPYQDSLEGIKRGANFSDKPSFTEIFHGIDYLTRLPASESAMVWSYIPENHEDVLDGDLQLENTASCGMIKTDNKVAGTWPQAVSGIAFGGLVPQTTKEIQEAVQFTVSGLPAIFDNPHYEGNKCDHWLNELEMLINECHRQSSESNLFGNYVKRRAEDYPNEGTNYMLTCYDTRDTAAVFGRYMTLIEHLIAVCSPTESLEDIQKEVTIYIQRSYLTAVREKRQQKEDSDQWSKCPQCLGQTVKNVRESYGASGTLNRDNIARIICCIIAAWADNVQNVRLYVRRTEDAVSDDVTSFMEDLPPFLALS
ncbi:hypothetical protein ASPFODRAFT_437045 [Aspergillus luchuensis CBS 106.47]|uniref:Uncharacterized protein n=1 Tax=Aspergillus luchuensis (strain CBS 106.47) TaxID=1137211 RepID=A0A1M3TVD0_ASPLC|nr:hypothetical protein ASPFODRAFT_437045 [Aspergillus luchuensis CBS 106.47]